MGYKEEITMEELQEFRQLAEEAEKIPIEELSKTAPLLTTRTYLDMCRVVYDATYDEPYPEDTPTTQLFCDARLWSYEHERDEGILGVDWDSPEQFAQKFEISYHNEELFFGGPSFYIHDETARIGEKCYTRPEQYGQWTGMIFCDISYKKDLCRAIKMYIALRRKQYPVYFPDYKKAYSVALKNLIKMS